MIMVKTGSGCTENGQTQADVLHAEKHYGCCKMSEIGCGGDEEDVMRRTFREWKTKKIRSTEVHCYGKSYFAQGFLDKDGNI